jgi:hypothetical protein
MGRSAYWGMAKGGYSYLCEASGPFYVVKAIHHEEVSYYKFGNKIQAENDSYAYLEEVPHPGAEMLRDRFRAGTGFKAIHQRPQHRRHDQEEARCLGLFAPSGGDGEKGKRQRDQHRLLSAQLHFAEGLLYYVDYEIEKFDKRYTFEVWGKNYWTGKKGLDK